MRFFFGCLHHASLPLEPPPTRRGGGRETPMVVSEEEGTTVLVSGIMILTSIPCPESHVDSTSTSHSPGFSRGVDDVGGSSDKSKGAPAERVALGILVTLFFSGIYGFVFQANTCGGRHCWFF